jgi:GNAT superfamily N-acetyltransferase
MTPPLLLPRIIPHSACHPLRTPILPCCNAAPPLRVDREWSEMKIRMADFAVTAECERILRTLPQWFGDEASLLDYAKATASHPTFVAEAVGGINGFLTLRRHFPEAWEIHCIAVEASLRNQSIGSGLLEHAEGWLKQKSARFLQVKTLAATHDSPAYAETREFYSKAGFVPIEVHPLLWAPHLPVLQLVKVL